MLIYYQPTTMGMLKKVLIVITRGEIGGAQMVVLNLAKNLRLLGVEVVVSVGENSFLTNELQKNNITTVIFKHLKRTFNPLSAIMAIFEFKKYFDKNYFDAIQLNSSNSLIAAIAGKISKTRPKIIFTFHGLSYLDPGSDKNWLIKKIFYLAFKTLLLFVNKNVFVCKSNLDQAKKIGLVKNGAVINNEVEIEAKSKTESREFLSNQIGFNLSRKIIIGSIGRLAYPKNYEYLINEMKLISANYAEVISIIIGEGPERKKYENLIKKLKLQDKCFLTGQISNAAQYLPAFDIFTLCSKYEGISITLLEASSLGIPILASDTGGTPEIINNKNLFELKPHALSNIFSKEYRNIINKKVNIKPKNKKNEMAQQYLNTILSLS